MKRVYIVLPVKFAARDVFYTPTLMHLGNCSQIQFVLLTADQQDQDFLAKTGYRNLQWKNIFAPESKRSYLEGLQCINTWKWLVYRGLLFWLRRRSGFGMLVYRFNHRHQFAGHVQKSKLPAGRKRREAQSGNFVSALYGVPFSKNPYIFDMLCKAYHSTWDAQPGVEALFKEMPPDLVVIAYPQNHRVRPYRLAAMRRSIPQIAIIGSWDKLTTKGPLGPRYSRYIVGSRAMLKELSTYHGVSAESVTIIGWPKMDCFKQPDLIVPRNVFLRDIGVPESHKIILFAGNSPRLGTGEPIVVRHIARQIQSGGYHTPCTLVVRPHPKDHLWENRFAELKNAPSVVVFEPEHGRIEFLANLLFHADVLVATQGSICLDAIAMDTCVVNVAYDADKLDNPHESIKNWYSLDHYRPIIENRATRLVENPTELDTAINAYLMNPALDRINRTKVTEECLEPFDGQASLRLVDAIRSFLDAS